MIAVIDHVIAVVRNGPRLVVEEARSWTTDGEPTHWRIRSGDAWYELTGDAVVLELTLRPLEAAL